MKPTYSLREAAAALDRSERYVWNQVRAGAIAAEKAGKSLALDAASVVAFARAHAIAVPGDDGGRVPPPPPARSLHRPTWQAVHVP
ncbi:MAG: hypothetical protein AABZ30_07010 [Myxococcota bacterium]